MDDDFDDSEEYDTTPELAYWTTTLRSTVTAMSRSLAEATNGGSPKISPKIMSS